MPSTALGAVVQARLDRYEASAAGLRALVEGPVAEDLRRRAIRVDAAAHEFARGKGGGPNVRTGKLWQSIYWRLGIDPISPYAEVGVTVPYGLLVEKGHMNTPHGYTADDGSYAYVKGPARARPFLKPALAAARVTIIY